VSDGKILAAIVKKMAKREEDPLSHLIHRYMIERELPENRGKRLTEWNISLKPNVRPLGRLSPSTIGGCERLAALKFLGVKGSKRVDPDSELIFDDGNWRHHKWQANFTEMEAILGPDTFQCVAIELPVRYKMLYIAGALDAHIRIADRDEMVDWIVDIKGINKFGFQDVFNSQEPKEAHVRQLIAYMRARKVRRGILLYDCKDDQRYQVFTITFTSKEWEKVSDWCESVIDQITYQKLPPMHPDCQHGTFLYEKCPYRKLCYGRYTTTQIERIAYKGFPGVDALWKEGLRIEEKG
jgi:hypothetical protein